MAWEKLASVKVGSAMGSAVDGTNSGITLITSGEALNTAVVDFGNITAQGNWEKTGSGGALTFTNGINQESGGSGNTQMPYLDLQNSSYLGSGNYASETKWTLRWKQTWASSPDNYGTPFMVLSSTTGYQSASQNYIGIRFDGSSITAGGETSSAVDGASSSTGVSTSYTSTTYYMELVRDGSNIYVRNYTSSAYDTIAQESSAISIGSGTYNLRYIKMIPRWDTGSGDYDTTWDNIKFYNGVAFQLKQNKLGTGAYTYDGSNDYTECGSAGDWNFLHDGTVNTVAFFVKRDGTQALSEPCVIDTQGASAGNTGMSIYWSNNSAGTLTCLISDGTGSDTKSVSCGDITDGEWTHIAIVNDGTNLTSYKNGDQHAQTSLSGFTPSGSAPAYTLNIGRNARSSAYFKGSVDDLSFWRRALTVTEIAKLAKNNVAGLGSTADGTISGAIASGSAPTGLTSIIQGYNGGTSEMNSGYGAGGGGGAGAVGNNESSTGSGDGGVGGLSSITGKSKYYAGGGGGGMHSGGDGIRGIGGLGGGGKAGYSAIQNTGSGAGGMSLENTNSVSGNGGAGQVILKFPTSGTTYTATDDTISYLDNVGGNTKQLDESANKYGICLHGNSQLVGKKLKSIAFNMKKNNSPTGNMNVKIYRESTTMQDWTEFEKLITNSSGNVATPYQLSTTANDTAWVLRFTVRYNRVWTGNSYVYIGLSNSDGGYNVAQNFLGTLFRKDSGNNFGVHTVQNAQPDSVNSQDQQDNSTSTDTEYYFEIVRTSATACTVKRYTDRSYSTVASNATSTYSSVSSSCTGLDRIKVFALNASTSEAQVHLTDVMFYNGVTSVSVNGSASATSANVSASGLGSSFAETSFTFSGSDIVELKAGDRIVFEGGSHDGTNQIQFENNARPFLHDVHMARYTSSWIDLFPNSPLFKMVLDPSPDTTSSSGNTILRFLSSGTFTLSGGTPNVEYLVLGGGGATGSQVGGGGGAGGFVTGTKSSMANGSYTVTIGAGGISGASSGWSGNGNTTASSSNGSDSVFSDVTAYGGGAGASNDSNGGSGEDGWDGASGGGQSYRGSTAIGEAIYNSGSHSFDGSNDTINIGNSLDSMLTGDFSFTTWAYMPNATSSGNKTIICKPATTSWANPYHSFTIQHTGGNIDFQTNNGSTNVNIDLACGQGWHHIAVTKSGTTFTLYIDGTTSESQTIANTAWGTQDWIIGNTPYNSRYFDGKIDDMAFWSRALTSTEINKLVNNNSPSPNITNSPAYTQVGSTVVASGTTIEATNAQTNQNPVHRVYKDIGSVSDSTFYFEFDYKQKQNSMNLYPISLQSGTGKTNIASEDMIYLKTDGLNLTIAKKNGGSNTNSSDGWITISANTQYYCSITRESNTASLKVYTDSGRSSNQVGGTKTVSVSDVSGLQYIHSESRGDGGGGTNMGWVLDNISLTNGATTKGSEGDAQLVSSLSNTTGLKAYYPLDSNANNSATAGEGQLTTSLADQTKLSAYYNMDTQGTQAWGGFTETDDFSLSSYETQPRACTISADGTYFYVVGDQGHSVDQFTMSTPYDLTTISHTRVQALGTSNPRGIYFKEDGTKMFVSYYGGTIKRYSLSTAWNVSTIGSADQSDTFESDSNDYNSVIGLFFKPDGTKFYTVVASDNAIKEYSCGSAWDVSSMSGSPTDTRDSLQADPSGLFISSDGLRLWYCEYNTDKVYQWNLSTAWDISTGSIDSTSYSVTANPFGLTMKPDGTKFYLVNDGQDEIQQFTGGGTCPNNHTVPTGETAIGDSLNTGVFTAKKYLKVHMKGKASSDISFKLQFNGDTGSTYSFRNSLNSATDPSPDTGASYLNVGTSFTGTANLFTDMDIINISNQEKLVIAETVGSQSGASNEMERKEFVGKWSNTASQISRIVATNSGSGNYDEGTAIIVYGTD